MDSFTISVETVVFLVALGVFFVISLCYFHASLFKTMSKEAECTYHQLLTEVKDVLDPSNLSIKEQLTERALANQRLVRALHLTNTFVSPELSVHKEFVTHAQRLLKGAQRRGWREFQNVASDAAQWHLSSFQVSSNISPTSQASHEAGKASFEFDSLIRNITLVVVLRGLLQVKKPVHSFAHHDIMLVAENISKLWALSKKPEPIPPKLLEDLTTHLHRLVSPIEGEDEQYPFKPLDFVIPAWETLWRVVAITVAYVHGDEDMKGIFQDFSTNPSDEKFRQLHGDKRSSVQGIVNEAFRLHPPSKHISRIRKKWWWLPSFLVNWIGQDSLTERRQADIEHLLRSDIWGPDADVFRPWRHNLLENTAERTQMMGFVFGHGPLRCIASSWAPMAVGIITGAILDQLDICGYALRAGPKIGGRDGWNDWVIEKEQ